MKMENQAWKGFHGGEWQRSIDVRSFIQKNWTPYEGDGSFLTGPTRRTRRNSNHTSAIDVHSERGAHLKWFYPNSTTA